MTMTTMDKEFDVDSIEYRKEQFSKEFVDLTKKWGIEIYAANMLLPNYEVVPQIKLLDIKVNPQHEDNTKK
jgi:hypothetical protein